MKRARVPETELGEVVVAHLLALGAEVYQEVDVPGGVADIVARLRPELWIVELKTSLSLALICQAMDRRRHAHRVVIAAPYTRNLHEVAPLCTELGIGVWTIHPASPGCDAGGGCGNAFVREHVRGRRWNSRPVDLAGRLTEEHKTHAKAGSAGAITGGGRWTPFRNTCERLAEKVAARPGITLKAAIEDIAHHYSSAASARSSLAMWIKEGKVPGVELRAGGALFPTEARR